MPTPHYDQPAGASTSKAGRDVVTGDIIFLDGAATGLVVVGTYRTNRATNNITTSEGTITLNNVDLVWVA